MLANKWVNFFVISLIFINITAFITIYDRKMILVMQELIISIGEVGL